MGVEGVYSAFNWSPTRLRVSVTPISKFITSIEVGVSASFPFIPSHSGSYLTFVKSRSTNPVVGLLETLNSVDVGAFVQGALMAAVGTVPGDRAVKGRI
jgi:hypothetical protein